MKDLLASARHDAGIDRVDRAVRSLEDHWRRGEPSLERHWAESDPEGTISVLAALVKADLRCRFARGEHPEVRDYLGRFPNLRDEGERVLSLIYEEFCLREERGEGPDVESFCRRYSTWRDSLASQLKYHRLLSQVVGPASPPPRFPEPGERFNEFTIDSVLGQGGAARVYRARNDLLGGREVALKVSPDRGPEPSIMGRLDHEHIVPVHNVVIQPETQLRGLIMPFRPGLTLDKVIERVRPSSRPRGARVLWDAVASSASPDPQAPAGRAGWGTFPMRGTYAEGVAWIIAALARALEHAHGRGILHRDIKPANILLTLRNGPQLLDFNLAHDPHAADQAEAALRGGTLPYMAPEQLEAFIDPDRWEDVGNAADLYSLGLVMHELLTGRTPEAPDNCLPLPRAIRSYLDRRADQRFEVRPLNPTIPPSLEAITRRCLAYAPEGRYPAAGALADDLQRFLDRQPLATAVNPSVRERLDNWTRRNWIRVATVAAVGGIGGYMAVLELTPVERRKEFLDAQAALDDKINPNPDQAVRLLEPLLTQYPKSPLLRIHLAAALGLSERVDLAANIYGQALPLPRSALADCRRRVPATLARLEALGIALSDDKFIFKHPGVVRVAVDDALFLGSSDPGVLLGAARVDEIYSDFAGARAKCSECIRLLEEETRGISPSSDPNRLIERYHIRARVTIKLAESLLANGGHAPQRRDESRNLLGAADGDLKRGKGLIKGGRREGDNDTVRAQLEIALGDLDLLEHRPAEALTHWKEAETLLNGDKVRDKTQEFKRLASKLGDLSRRIRAEPGWDLTQAP